MIRTSLCALALATAATSLCGAASAQDYYHGSRDYHRHHDRRYSYDHRRYHGYDHDRTCGADRRARGNNGTAIGAVSGGILGSALGGGHLGNVLLGAGAGAVAGHAIGKSTSHC
ncbi:MAG: hypothetical protein ABI242_07955 [Caulobacteraceae bacterium]